MCILLQGQLFLVFSDQIVNPKAVRYLAFTLGQHEDHFA